MVFCLDGVWVQGFLKEGQDIPGRGPGATKAMGWRARGPGRKHDNPPTSCRPPSTWCAGVPASVLFTRTSTMSHRKVSFQWIYRGAASKGLGPGGTPGWAASGHCGKWRMGLVAGRIGDVIAANHSHWQGCLNSFPLSSPVRGSPPRPLGLPAQEALQARKGQGEGLPPG